MQEGIKGPTSKQEEEKQKKKLGWWGRVKDFLKSPFGGLLICALTLLITVFAYPVLTVGVLALAIFPLVLAVVYIVENFHIKHTNHRLQKMSDQLGLIKTLEGKLAVQILSISSRLSDRSSIQQSLNKPKKNLQQANKESVSVEIDDLKSSILGRISYFFSWIGKGLIWIFSSQNVEGSYKTKRKELINSVEKAREGTQLKDVPANKEGSLKVSERVYDLATFLYCVSRLPPDNSKIDKKKFDISAQNFEKMPVEEQITALRNARLLEEKDEQTFREMRQDSLGSDLWKMTKALLSRERTNNEVMLGTPILSKQEKLDQQEGQIEQLERQQQQQQQQIQQLQQQLLTNLTTKQDPDKQQQQHRHRHQQGKKDGEKWVQQQQQQQQQQ